MSGSRAGAFRWCLMAKSKVSRQSSEGRSLELYRVVPGEICLSRRPACLATRRWRRPGVTARASRLVLLPPPLFSSWLALPAFREAVLGLFAERMADLTALVDAVAFRRLDQRLAAACLVVDRTCR